MENCKTCRFMFELESHHMKKLKYWCKRFPPLTVVDFPQTALHEWCGEWQAKPEKPKAKKPIISKKIKKK